MIEHLCHCGAWGAFGYRVRLLNGMEGEWYCRDHRPNPAPMLSEEEVRVKPMDSNKIPERFVRKCEICTNDLDMRLMDGSICQYKAGWVTQRARGTHGIMLQQTQDRWVHRYCVDYGQQTTMFGSHQ